MLSDEQKRQRHHGIGSSEIAAVVGLSPWRSPMDVWLVKVGLKPPFEGNEATEIGNAIEEWIARQYISRNFSDERYFIDEVAIPLTMRHPRWPWALATPDFVTSDEVILEIKNVGPRSTKYWDDKKADGIPVEVYCQVQWQMFVTGLHKAVVCALLGGVRLRWWHVDYDEAFALKLAVRAEEFWKFVLISRLFMWLGLQPIAPDHLDSGYQKALYPENDGEMLEATPYLNNLAEDVKYCKEKSDSYLATLERYKAELKAIIGPADGIEGICTYKADKRGRRVFRWISRDQ